MFPLEITWAEGPLPAIIRRDATSALCYKIRLISFTVKNRLETDSLVNFIPTNLNPLSDRISPSLMAA